ncbi:glycoside hydrolase [Thermosipho melanesiensis]|uniref:Glycoside hydrolase, family 85 n=2 Tax=Thermosipho melanesiensis TaxID=46541 RepID=A6LLS6_THEM4|nr:discoidin domain-containing protein [Thermosipho melanesiensis]ABR30877.1 glycoside hydrolase, family 85 [Thermosipho melanesiensis BI429]APT73996.1 glycoside hydrolase [Thermosipho melanesiensis]OOC35926.1 glycoside hydrolase [Thermosipho melanesiensis]OOC38428.1 glycoside hydrolase [Thermosipho melanesiensis]OOC38889.1 glycoside hydrolase [Thermosipho melanesiensis]
MKKLVFILLIIFSIFVYAIPESSYWYPNDLLDWKSDPNIVYNISHIPLAKRIYAEPITNFAEKDVKIMVLSIMNPSTSGMPSQGSNNSFKTYPFSFWQYVDYLVAWAGSAGEGIIVPPSADVIDLAHKNGVYVLGTIFFPPNIYGGRRNWVDQLLKEENGKFIIADKLIEVAETYGFDGWFINQETKGCNETHVKKMINFLNYLKEKAPWMKVVWYDAMSKIGAIEWQGELNENNVVYIVNNDKKLVDAIFLDFRWQSLKRPETIENTLNTMKKYNLKKDDIFVGFDLQANGFYTYSNWPKIIDENGKLKVSLGFYCPSWAYYSTKNISKFWQNEETLWIADHPVLTYNGKEEFFKIKWNENYKQYRWQAPSKFVVEKSPITSLPFITHFNAGHGYAFYVDGKKLSNIPWNNRSLMDIFPTYRWKVTGPIPKIFVDYSTAYYGGSSLKIQGNLEKGERTLITLYAAELYIENPTILETVIKGTGNIKTRVILTFENNKNKSYELKLFDDWVKTIYNLETEKNIKYISFEIEGSTKTSYNINIGKIGIIPVKNEKVRKVTNVKIDELTFKEGLYAQMKLHWNKSNAEYYEIYRIKNGKREFVWATYNNYTYISEITRYGKETSTTLEIVGVSKDMQRSIPTKISFNWPPYPKPKANFEVSNTIILPNSSVTFFDKSSKVTEKWLWILPGATPNVSYEKNPVVTYKKEGIYPAILVAMNSEGEDVKIYNPLIVVTTKAKNIKNLALNKKTYASSNVPTEKPSMAVDGTVENNSKWCAVGELPHWLVIDFGKEVIISSVIIKHAEAGHESPDWNTKDFRLQASDDGKSWKDISVVKGNTKGITKHSFAPVKTRYFRLFVETPTQTGDKAARIYEVEVYGLESF